MKRDEIAYEPLMPTDDLRERMARVWPTTLEERLAHKREESEADARGEDLWLARGGRDE